MSTEKMLKDAVKAGKLVIGAKSVSKAIKNDSVSAVFVSSNCPADVKKDVAYYGSVSKAEVVDFSGNAAQLGQFCGKPFKIAILGIEK